MCGRGVLRYCMIDLAAESLLRDPSRDVLSMMIRFDALTPNSTLISPFHWINGNQPMTIDVELPKIVKMM